MPDNNEPDFVSQNQENSKAINDSNLPEIIDLEKNVREQNYGADASIFEEKRKDFRLKIASGLAFSLWAVLLLSVLMQCLLGSFLSYKLSTLSKENNSEHIKEAIAETKSNAKDIYTFLTPLVTGVIAFYFGVSNTRDP
jgi:hypothetical protein